MFQSCEHFSKGKVKYHLEIMVGSTDVLENISKHCLVENFNNMVMFMSSELIVLHLNLIEWTSIML